MLIRETGPHYMYHGEGAIRLSRSHSLLRWTLGELSAAAQAKWIRFLGRDPKCRDEGHREQGIVAGKSDPADLE